MSHLGDASAGVCPQAYSRAIGDKIDGWIDVRDLDQWILSRWR